MPRLGTFDGRDPISLLRFLREIRQALYGVGLNEGAAVRTISWFLVDSPLQVYSTHVFSRLRAPDHPTSACWGSVVKVQLDRFLTDDVFAEAHARVTNARQESGETETEFANRLEGYADSCAGVYSGATLTSHFIQGLLPTTQPIVAERARRLPPQDRTNLSVVRRLA